IPEKVHTMNPTVLAALITAVIGPTITIVVKKVFDEWSFSRIPRWAKTALNGVWEGDGQQPTGPDEESIPFHVRATLTCGWKSITGNGIATYTLPDIPDVPRKYTAEYSLSGEFADPVFLKLDYRNKDIRLIQFGTMVLRLDGEK